MNDDIEFLKNHIDCKARIIFLEDGGLRFEITSAIRDKDFHDRNKFLVKFEEAAFNYVKVNFNKYTIVNFKRMCHSYVGASVMICVYFLQKKEG